MQGIRIGVDKYLSNVLYDEKCKKCKEKGDYEPFLACIKKT